jgi:uncharacterized SAM-binding protein YcdF (DUF218 family)
VSVLKALVLPPGGIILFGLIGLWIARRRFRLGAAITATALGLLYVMSTGVFGGWALSLLSPAYTDPRARPDAQAIVALAGGTYGFAPEYEGDMVSRLTLMRVRYAAHLHRLTGKPILVSGGTNSAQVTTEAQQMRALLRDEFKVPVRWIEDRSRNTFENALESRRVLAPLGVDTIYLVTSAWHMPRARLAFEHAGFAVIPAPTGFSTFENIGYQQLLPQPSGLLNSYYFFHEITGYAWYWIRTRL